MGIKGNSSFPFRHAYRAALRASSDSGRCRAIMDFGPREHTQALNEARDKARRKNLARKAVLALALTAILISPAAIYAQDSQQSQHHLAIAFAEFDGAADHSSQETAVRMLEKDLPNCLWRELYIRGFNVIEAERLEAMLEDSNVNWEGFLKNPYKAVGKAPGIDVIIRGSFTLGDSDQLFITVKLIDEKTGRVLRMETYTDMQHNYRGYKEYYIPPLGRMLADDIQKLEQ